MSYQGRVLDVNPDKVGDELAVDTAAGATVLVVVDVADFDEGGGLLLLGDEVLAYETVDDDTSTITLADPTTVDAEAGDSVQLWDSLAAAPAVEWTAQVLLDDSADGDPLVASIDHGLIDAFPDGIRDALQGESVVLERDDSDIEIVDILGKQLTRDLSFADPTTIPEPVAVEPPEESPAVTVTGMPSGLVIAAEKVASTTLITYHIGITSDFIPDTDTASGPATHSTVHVANTLPDGSPFVAGTTYYVRTVASNTAGEAAPSDAVEARLDLDAVADLIAAQLVAGFAIVGSIQIGAMTIDADNGLDIPGILNIPVNGIDVPSWLGFFTALGLTVRDNLNIYGIAQLAGKIIASNGISDPRVKARLSADWPNQTIADIGGGPTESSRYRGLAWDSATDLWFAGFYFFGPGIHLIDPATGEVVWSMGVTGTHTGPNFEVYGYTYLAGSHYFLGVDSSRSGRRFVYIVDSTGAKTGEWEYVHETGSPYDPTLGNDGTNIIIARCSSSGAVAVRSYDPATGTVAASAVVTTHSPEVDLTGVYWGSADFGDDRIVVSHLHGFYVYDNTGVRHAGQEWGVAGATWVRVFGWDGTEFSHMDASGRLWRYLAGHTSTSTIYGGYTWPDTDTGGTGTHETAVSPAQSFSWPARTRLNIKGDSAPDAGVIDPSLHDLANQVAIYAGTSSTTMRLQAVLAVGEDSWTATGPLDTGSAIAPTTSDYPTGGSAPGGFESAEVDGSGTPLTYWNGDGSGRAMLDHQAGAISTGAFTGTGSGNANVVHVTFAVPFLAPPVVNVWNPADPALRVCWAESVDEAGFDLNAYRTSGTGAFSAQWAAFATTQ